MKHLDKLFGIIVYMALIGFSMAACKEPEESYDYTFINESSYDVEIVCGDFNLSSFVLLQGGSRKVSSSKSVAKIDYFVLDEDGNHTGDPFALLILEISAGRVIIKNNEN